MTEKALIANLQYIAESPARGHGGFHEQTVETAKAALKQLADVRAKLEKTEKALSRSLVFHEAAAEYHRGCALCEGHVSIMREEIASIRDAGKETL